MRIFLVLIMAVMLLAGCGSDKYESGISSGDYKYVVLPYEGSQVTCIKWSPDAHQGGLACDFEQFHHLHGWHPGYYSPDLKVGG